MRTFCAAVSRVNGGNGGRDSVVMFIENPLAIVTKFKVALKKVVYAPCHIPGIPM
jgi:hypothetical protein